MTKVFVVIQEKNYTLEPVVEVVAAHSAFEDAVRHASIIKTLGETEVHEVELDPPVEEPQISVTVATS